MIYTFNIEIENTDILKVAGRLTRVCKMYAKQLSHEAFTCIVDLGDNVSVSLKQNGANVLCTVVNPGDLDSHTYLNKIQEFLIKLENANTQSCSTF